MIQTTFNDVMTHCNDPAPAKEAARQMHKSGAARLHREMVLQAVRDYPGATAPEVGRVTGLGHIEAQRRLSDLKNSGEVLRGDGRICGVKNKKMSTWSTIKEAS